MALIDPSLVTALGFLFNKQVTIQQTTQTQDAAGAPVDAWADLAGHVNIPCVLEPANPTTSPDEKRQADLTLSYQAWTVMLQGFYPAIESKMRAVIASTSYDIIGAQSDSQDLITNLLVQLVQ